MIYNHDISPEQSNHVHPPSPNIGSGFLWVSLEIRSGLNPGHPRTADTRVQGGYNWWTLDYHTMLVVDKPAVSSSDFYLDLD